MRRLTGSLLRSTRWSPVTMVSTIATLIVPPLAAQGMRLDHHALTKQLSALCRADEASDSSALQQRRAELAAKLHTDPADTALWHAFACVVSLQYARSSGEPAATTALAMPAIRAWARLLEDNPADSRAVTGIATLAFELAGGPGLPNAILNADGFATLAYAAVHAGVSVPIVLRLCTEFAFLTSDVTTARYCNHQALATGRDSTWQLIRGAWFAFLNDERPAAAMLFDQAIAAANDSASLAEAAWHVGRLARGALDSGWSGLHDSARVAWVHAHIASSDSVAEPYPVALAHFEGDVPQHGPMFAVCPFDVIRNGMHVAVDQRSCRVPTAPVRRIGVAADLMRLWDPASGEPIAILTYALDRKALTVNTSSEARVATVALNWRIWEWQSSEWTDSSLAVH
ncbi:MAG: hypothetical protein ACREK8_08580, partial [Gemmatimonadales bacterium]